MENDMSETVQAYKAHDGTLYESQAKRDKYDTAAIVEAKSWTYWRVIHGPDCTEGRGYYHCTYIKAKCRDLSMLEDYCYRTFGRKVAFVQGVSPMPAWTLTKLSIEQYGSKQGARHGDYTSKWVEVELVIGKRESGLIDKKAPASVEEVK
jgi:hypothetical protein